MSHARLKGAFCYELGPIQYASDNGINWRTKATKFLNNLGIGVFNPLDKPCDHAVEGPNTQKDLDFLKKAANNALEEGNKAAAEIYYHEIHRIMKDITSIDLRLCDKSDFGLMFSDPTIYSAGTWVEYGKFMLDRKPVVMWLDGPITQIPFWAHGTTHFSLMHTSLDNALEYIRSIHEDENINRLNRWKFFDLNKVFSVQEVKANKLKFTMTGEMTVSSETKKE
jgi:nucleoside 2-deoxyribosyltransferase